jgi:hypothetical protein
LSDVSDYYRLEAQVSDIKTWKDKAQQLEHTVLIQRKQLEEHDRQNRMALRTFQRSLAQTNAHMRNLTIQTGVTMSRDCSPSPSPTRDREATGFLSGRISSRSKRPASASAALSTSRQSTLQQGTTTQMLDIPNHEAESLKESSILISNKEKDMMITLLEAKLSKAITKNDYLEKKVKSLAKSLAKARACPLLSLSDKTPPKKNMTSSAHHADVPIVDDEFASFIDKESRASPIVVTHAASSDSSENEQQSDSDDSIELPVVDHGYEKDPRTMNEIRRENSKNANQAMLAMQGSKKRISFHPSTARSNALYNEADDGSEDWFDPKFQVEEELRKQARSERKNTLATDLRNRISMNRESRTIK